MRAGHSLKINCYPMNRAELSNVVNRNAVSVYQPSAVFDF